MEQVLDLFLKEAEASDAECLLDFFKDVATESDFMTLAPRAWDDQARVGNIC